MVIKARRRFVTSFGLCPTTFFEKYPEMKRNKGTMKLASGRFNATRTSLSE
jgi:hypothetical protein